MFGRGCVLGMDSRFRRPLNNRHSREQPSFPRRRESRAGGSLLGMLGISATLSPATGVTQRSPFAGTTVVGWPGALHDGCWGACAGTTDVWGGCVLGMDSRFRRPLNNRHSREQPSFPRRRESRAGGSLLGMLGISATLSPATGVTQRSPFACMTDVGCLRVHDGCWGCLGGNDGFGRACVLRDGFPACAGTTDVWGRLRVGDGFPLSETFEQPSFPRTTVIPAKAGIQDWGFPARNAGHLRHAVSRNGSYAKVSFRVHDGCGKRGLRVGDGFPPTRA